MNSEDKSTNDDNLKVHFYKRSSLTRKINHVVYIIARFVFRYVAMLLFGFRVHNSKNIPENAGYILIGNHQSHLDPIFFPVASKHDFAFAARHTLFKNPLFGRLISFLGAFPLKRGVRDNFAFKQMKIELSKGDALIVFPEGTRALDEKLLSFKSGVEIIIKLNKVPLLPAVIQGNTKIFPKHRKLNDLTAKGTMNVLFGKVIEPEEYLAYPRREFMKIIEEKVRALDTELKIKPYYKSRGITVVSDVIIEVLNFNTTLLFKTIKGLKKLVKPLK